MTVHFDNSAHRAVDACGGIYTAAEEASGFANGHRAALASALVAVEKPDALTAELLEALQNAIGDLEQTLKWRGEGWECSDDELLGHYRSVVAKATGAGQ